MGHTGSERARELVLKRPPGSQGTRVPGVFCKRVLVDVPWEQGWPSFFTDSVSRVNNMKGTQ